VRAYDPKAMEEARTMLPDATIFTDSAATCLEDADVAVVVTEWNEFRALTPAHYLDSMRGKVLVDLRNIYRPEDMREAGLSYSLDWPRLSLRLMPGR
jgi:UDPglucose 6-dehydrogenase